MPIFIYRGGSPNPQPQNPLVRFLVSAAILAVIIGLGVLLLPVIGAIALLVSETPKHVKNTPNKN